MEKLEILEGSIELPKGFLASGIFAGIKKRKKDVALIYSEKVANASAVFTTNKVKAAPVILDMERIKKGVAQAIVINSGNANACTGEKGFEDAVNMAKKVSQLLKIDEENVLVCSTGVIGVPLPMEKVLKGIEAAAENLSTEGGYQAAEAIMTTDTFLKGVTAKFVIEGKIVTMTGFAKGSGMIHPNMATMLSFVLTDANITKTALNKAFKETVDKTYNMISVDGDMSTNDTAIILANGEAQNKTIEEGTHEFDIFYRALEHVNKILAKLIVKDGEGATKFMEVNIVNAKTEKDARLAAKSIVNSNLVKTAIFGEDANWGRILAAVGYSGADFDASRVDIYLKSMKGEIKVCENGGYIFFDEALAKEILKEKEITVTVDMKAGEYSGTAWGCDLSYDYVKINGSYRT
ncbi:MULTISPECIES: bifunctional glutamate N-acetyltransferase/amino-acid acetyltransferase ArgJ [Thermoanaerobacter]|uniref:Arginine biosynthesis bifunctional protein ArgJ n=2 Tax=Thermoanaerobacter TaxID=1754 RepID=B0KBW0_THEP3|nr:MULTISPECIES: bifunctional glutamate N-acetyltransferase/amino-acid acetyltransferase ArgJ [Thermoanaerobacter]ABY93896.1 arginine biosynthesis bifunctional protein ArgJ [Thermoanaerobacter pseudethanolicus ATCC 33223]ADV78857.1 arginine biosynthesis bifunctional protein ArgJ [Thermoanaerobacter brockii subsp. finnii Ako-1]HBW60481.1 bifunctional glutamate N-acetyltransferase/amino-acid acetyltransferase ArgJ [Thermoanaerobacter sp.]